MNQSRPLPYFQRTALIVSNIEQSLLLYLDVLGFSLEFIGEDTPDAYSYSIFKIDRQHKTRFATLSSEQQQRTLAFIEVPNVVIYPEEAMRLTATVIQVDSVERVLIQAQQLGLTTLPIMRHESPAKGPARCEAGLFDFDGHPVVVYEILNP